MANILLVLKSSTCKYLQVLASCFLRVKSLLDKYLVGVERPSTCKYLIPGTALICFITYWNTVTYWTWSVYTLILYKTILEYGENSSLYQ